MNLPGIRGNNFYRKSRSDMRLEATQIGGGEIFCEDDRFGDRGKLPPYFVLDLTSSRTSKKKRIEDPRFQNSYRVIVF